MPTGYLDLKAWQQARVLTLDVYHCSYSLPYLYRARGSLLELDTQ